VCEQLSEVCASSHAGYPILVFHCALKVVCNMKTLLEAMEQRVAFYAALVRYMTQLFIEKDRVHYASKRWWRDILIGVPKVALANALLATVYFMLRTDPSYDIIISILLAAQPLAYFTFVALNGQRVA